MRYRVIFSGLILLLCIGLSQAWSPTQVLAQDVPTKAPIAPTHVPPTKQSPSLTTKFTGRWARRGRPRRRSTPRRPGGAPHELEERHELSHPMVLAAGGSGRAQRPPDVAGTVKIDLRGQHLYPGLIVAAAVRRSNSTGVGRAAYQSADEYRADDR